MESAPEAPVWIAGRPYAGDIAALLITLPLAVTVLLPGWFFGHDNMHLLRLFEQDVMIRAGQFPVRWYPDVAGGYGSSHPQYYAPLFYLLAQLFALAGLSIGASLKGAIVVVIATTSVAMYRLARTFFGDGAGLIAAAAYTYAPYHLLDLFVRTAFSELTVFVFLPLVLLAFLHLSKKITPGRIAIAAATLGGLCLSHTITVMLVPPLLGGYVGLLAWREKSRGSFLAASGTAAILGFALAGFFLLPLVLEQGAVETEIYAAAYFDYKQHFVLPFQLIHSPWGFGLSRAGADDGVSFRLGLIQIAGCVLAAFSWKGLRRSSPSSADHVAFATAVSVAGIFMATALSAPIWAATPPLRFVQFPWRFLMLPAFGTAFIAGAGANAALELIRDRGAPSRRDRASAREAVLVSRPGFLSISVALMIGAVFIAASIEMIGFKKRIPYERIGFGGDHTDMRERDEEEARLSPTVFTREFVRSQTLHWFDHLPPGGYPYPPKEDLKRSKAEIASGRATVEMLEETPARYRMRMHATDASVLRLNVYRFPGWTWFLDGRPTEPAAPQGRRPAMAIEVPPGDHDLVATFKRTPARWAGDLASLGSLFGIAGLAAASLRKIPPRD